jgi:UDP-glucose 4-epimerase
MKKTCLVTGGLGFIGSNLVDRLIALGHEVVVVDNLSTGKKENANPSVNYEYFSILDLPRLSKVVKEVKPNWIFHLAAWPRIQPSFDDPIGHDEVNVRGCINLIHACKEVKEIEAIINSSSSSIYGDPVIYPTPESAQISPLSPYALQKYAGERYIHILGERYGLPVASVRYFNVYGPRSFDPKNPFNAYSSVVGIFENQIKSGSPITITGNGSQERDFVHVWDVADANICVAKNINKAANQVFNVGTGKKISILELAKLFNASYKFTDKRIGEALITHADSSKLRKLGWINNINLEEAINSGNL